MDRHVLRVVYSPARHSHRRRRNRRTKEDTQAEYDEKDHSLQLGEATNQERTKLQILFTTALTAKDAEEFVVDDTLLQI